MAFYGSSLSNETLFNGRQPCPARHIACQQRLKYIQNINDGFIPYVEDSSYTNRSSYRNGLQNRLCLYNTADVWRQELMGLAQQVQSSLIPIDESQQSRSSRLHHHYHSKRSRSTLPRYHDEENDDQNIPKRLLNRPTSTRFQLIKSKNEQELSISNENQDAGIWLLPILCHILQINNIIEAQDWLINANPTEKRLAMKLISRTMQDIQNNENDFIPDVSTCDSSSTSSNLNNIYWPYKFWQYQKQLKINSYPSLTIDNNDTCERGTSPLRLLTPAKRSSTRSTNDRATSSIISEPNQRPLTGFTKDSTKTRRPSSRMSTPMTANSSDRLSRRSYHVTTSRSTQIDDNYLPKSATSSRGKRPLI